MTNPMAKSRNDLLREMISVLDFYRALGFERLPIKVKKSTSIMKMPSKRPQVRSGKTKADLLKELREEIGDCRRCKLADTRTHIVFGEGDPEARLMFIGEAPGREEDLQGRPFVGDAGVVLTRLIEKMGLTRREVYIANIIKCRPPMNRDPEADEIGACRGFLERQIDIIEPGVIMTLGRIAAQTLMGNTKAKITSIRGNFFDYKGIPVMPTFHPAYLIRNPKDKWLTWDDAKKVMERLNHTITDALSESS